MGNKAIQRGDSRKDTADNVKKYTLHKQFAMGILIEYSTDIIKDARLFCE